MFEIIATITLVSLALILYHHAGYPILLKFVYLISQKSQKEKENNALKSTEQGIQEYPSITLLIPAYNEADYIADKIRNVASLDYPREKLNVIIATDGCTDNTADIARQTAKEFLCMDLRISVKEFKQNAGKVRVINRIAPAIFTDLLAFSDVSSLISLDALKKVAQKFQDPEVGGVNGNYRFLNPGSSGEENYWKYQSAIKIGEEALGSVLGAHGAFYCIRAHLFHTLPEDCINDDFVIPMRIIERGYRVSYESCVNAVELESATNDQDWSRRLRIGYGNAQQIALLKSLLNPRYKGVALAFFSGKTLRTTMPLFMFACFVGSWALAFNPLFLLLALGQTLAYGLALYTHYHPTLLKSKLLNTLHYIVSGHLANALGALRFVRGQQNRQWS